MKQIFKVNKLSILGKDNKELLSDIDIKLYEKEIVILEGENGVGKSTLLNAIFKNPNYIIKSGDISYTIDNVSRDITNLQTFEMARLGLFLSIQDIPEIAGVSTIKMLYNAYQNIYPEDKISIIDFKKKLEDDADHFKIDRDLLNRDLNDRFSGGQKKQIALLYILALSPNIIFMDEPDSGVDKDAINKVYRVIKHLHGQGKTILLISHNIDIQNHLAVNRLYRMNRVNDKVNIEEIKLDKKHKDNNLNQDDNILSEDMMN